MMLSQIKKGLSCIAEHLGDDGWNSINLTWDCSKFVCSRDDRKYDAMYYCDTGRLVKFYKHYDMGRPLYEVICEGDAEVSAD